MGLDWIKTRDHEGYSELRNGTTLKILLNRPKKGNALTFAMLEGIRALLEKVANDPTIFRIVLAGEGRFFCTGMDLSTHELGQHHGIDPKQRQWDGIVKLQETIVRSPKITIAVINGPAYGAGIGIAFACDIRLSIESATFTVSEAKLGIPPTVILKQLIKEWGVPRAREATLSARAVTAQELLTAGLIAQNADDKASLEALADAYIDRLGACGPEAARLSKNIFFTTPTDLDRVLKSTYDTAMAPSAETQYGLDCFHNKKQPDWEAFYNARKSKL